MSAPRVKRQFAGDASQRTITSYYAPSQPAAAGVVTSSSSRTPALPASVQANLISVGMRVRKSVPEGYKTSSDDCGVFKLWTDARTPGAAGAAPAPARASRVVPGGARELLPFCGIHKVGGFAVPPTPAPQIHVREPTPTLDDLPGLSHGHDSVGSSSSSDAAAAATSPSTWSRRSAKKRIFHDDEEEEHGAAEVGDSAAENVHVVRVWDSDVWLLDDNVSPRTVVPPAEFAAGRAGPPRAIALPRRKKSAKPGWSQRFSLDKKKPSGEDFEDAAFLDLSSYNGELEMRDI